MRTLFVLFGIFILPSVAFGSNFEDLTGIYVHGDIGFIKMIMTAVQKAVTSSEYIDLVYIASFIAVIMVGIELWYKKDFVQIAKSAAVPLTIIGFLHYTTDVHIEDVRAVQNITPGTSAYSVGTVPSLLGAMYGASSAFELVGINLVDDALNSVAGTQEFSTSKIGFAVGLTKLSKVIEIASDQNFMDRNETTYNFSQALKTYALECVLPTATSSTIYKIKSPDRDLIDIIDPNALGLTDNDTLEDGTKCSDYYNDNLKSKESEVADILGGQVAKQLNVDLANLAEGLNQVGSINVQSNQLAADALGSQKGFIANAAMIAPLNAAITQNNNNLQTGVDYANAITAQSAIEQIQMGGIGVGKWFATIAPYVFHILKGVIYFYGIFVPIIAIMLGSEKGSKYILSYFMSLIGFAAVGIGMAVSSDIVTYFASKHFADYVSSIGAIPSSISALKQYYLDMATYTGVAGFLGATIAMIAPSLILKGQASAAMSAMTSLSSAYKSGPDAAMDVDTTTKAKESAYNKEMEEVAKQKLGKAGFSLADIPSGVSAGDYYQKLQDQASRANASMGAYNQRDNITDAAVADRYRTEQKIGSDLGFAGSMASAGGGDAAFRGGQVEGAVQAASVVAESAEFDNMKSISSAAFKQASSKLQSMIGYDESVDLEKAKLSGRFEGISAGAKASYIGQDKNLEGDARTLGTDAGMQTIGKAAGLQKAHIFNEDGSINETSRDKVTGQLESDKYKQGIENSARIQANKTQGVGRLGELSEEDMTNIQRTSQASSLSEFSKGEALKKKYGANLDKKLDVKDNHGKHIGTVDGYRGQTLANASLQEDKAIGSAAGYNSGQITPQMLQQNAAYGLISQTKATDAKIDTQGGVNKAVAADVAESSLKAKMQQMGTQGSIEQYLQSKAGSGYKPDEAKKMAQAIMQGGQDAAKFMADAIKGAGALAFAQSGGKTGADIKNVETQNEKYKDGGYVGYMKDSATVQAAGATKKLEVSKNFGQEKADAYIKGIVGKSTGKDAEQLRKKAINDLHKSGLTDKDGKALSGLDAAIAQEEATVGTMNRDTRMMIGKNRVNFSTNANTGETIANVDGSTVNKQGDSDITDNSSTLKQFSNKDIARTLLKLKDPNREPTEKEINALASSEQFATALQRGNYGKAMAANGLFNLAKDMNLIPKNMNENQFHAALDAAIVPASVAGTVGAEMAMEKAYKAGTGQRVFTQDYATGKFDKDGKPIIMHKGDEFNLKDFDPEERGCQESFTSSRYQSYEGD